MAAKKFSTQYPGVRFRKHPTRKYSNKFDQYFFIRYRVNGKLKEEGVGWASDGWNAFKASKLLGDLKSNKLTGKGPLTLAEKRILEEEARQEAKAEREKLEKESITFGDFFEKTYYPIAKTSKKENSYREEWSHFKNWLKPNLGDIPIKSIYPIHLEKIKKMMLERKRAPRMVQYVFSTFRISWNMAKRDQLVDRESPTKEVRIPRVDNRRMRFLTLEEAEMLLEKLKEKSQQVHDISLISLHCGLRAGDIFQLRWGDLDVNAMTIRIRDPKGRPGRTAYMTERVKEALSKLEKGKHDGLIFKNLNGDPITEISNTFERAVVDIGLNEGVEDKRQKVVFHTLRHTFASWLVQGGESLYSVKELMGHASIATTERYSHLAETQLHDAVKNLEKKIDQKKNQVVKLQKGNTPESEAQ